MLHTLKQDLLYAGRSLLRTPLFTVTSAIVLTLGVGANAAIFSVVDAVLLRPLPYPDAERIVHMRGTADWVAWKRGHGFRIVPNAFSESPLFEAVGVYAPGGVNVGGDAAERTQAAAVTPGFLEALGVSPQLGRRFSQKDVDRDPRIAIIGDGLWRRQFGADPDVLGRSVVLNGVPHVVVGVMPPRVEFPAATELWVPSESSPSIVAGVVMPQVLARLAVGTTPAAANELGLRLLKPAPGVPDERRAVVTPLREMLAGHMQPVLRLVAAGAALVLLAAWVNTAILVMGRIAARERELAVRGALGASRMQLAQTASLDIVVVSVVSGLAAIPLAHAGVAVIRGFVPPTLHGVADIAIDMRTSVVVFSLAASIAIALALGVLFRLRHGAPIQLTGDVQTVTRASGRIRGSLVVAQIAMAVVLLAAAVALVRKVAELTNLGLGATGERAIVVDLALPVMSYPSSESRVRFYERLDADLRGIPGVEEVGASNAVPHARDTYAAARIEIEGQSHESGLGVSMWATPGYFRALGIDLLAGRYFGAADRPGALPVTIVSEGVARRAGLAPANAAGRRATVDWTGTPEAIEIAGVVGDIRLVGPENAMTGMIYRPLAQLRWPDATVHVVVKAAEGDPLRFVAAVRAAVRRIDPNLPIHNIRTFEDIRDAFIADRRLAMTIILAFGTLAAVLCMAALYGTTAYLVQLRTREFGIRMAIGASPSRLLRHAVGGATRHVILGVLIGMVGAFAASRAVAAHTTRFGDIDPTIMAVVGGMLSAVGLLATWIPARRSSRIDPARALWVE
jgi:putative ABC transport system permease protein